MSRSMNKMGKQNTEIIGMARERRKVGQILSLRRVRTLKIRF